MGILWIIFFECLSPFNFFQAGSCALWFYEEYDIYPWFIIAMVALNVANETYNIKSSFNRIKRMVERTGQVEVLRDGKWINVDSNLIVPGDIIQLHAHSQIPTDVLIMNGKCIVNEALLTGESIPLTKVQIGDEPLKEKNILY